MNAFPLARSLRALALTFVPLAAATAYAATEPAAGAAAAPTFNPAVSLILSGTYADLERDPETFRIGGFFPAGEEIGPGDRGFRLTESELVLSANVDPYFYGAATLAVTPQNEVEVEEAFFQTRALPAGLTVKAGRFFSGVGYLNEVHAHAWDFVDQPLAYQAFLGGQIRQEGVQLKWLAPADLFVELGVEAGNGAQFPGTDRNKNGIGAGAAFVHVGGDVGASNSWRAGISHLRHSPRDRLYEDEDALGTPVANSFSGTSRLWIADFVWKWAPNGNPAQQNFKLQAEYFRRRERGDLTFDVDGTSAAGTLTDRYEAAQSGGYVQSVYQFMPRWRAGLRYDRLRSGTPTIGQIESGALVPEDLPLLARHQPSRATVMGEFNPSEFSRFRVQLARDKSRPDVRDTQIFLQYIHSLGAHGAHKF
ncbi:MAG TPA: hypothetical protein VFR86_25555 [Burkholderiaceae bacterium]|nr:hypothetical protein [Burkholderiaceae bacterium]